VHCPCGARCVGRVVGARIAPGVSAVVAVPVSRRRCRAWHVGRCRDARVAPPCRAWCLGRVAMPVSRCPVSCYPCRGAPCRATRVAVPVSRLACQPCRGCPYRAWRLGCCRGCPCRAWRLVRVAMPVSRRLCCAWCVAVPVSRRLCCAWRVAVPVSRLACRPLSQCPCRAARVAPGMSSRPYRPRGAGGVALAMLPAACQRWRPCGAGGVAPAVSPVWCCPCRVGHAALAACYALPVLLVSPVSCAALVCYRQSDKRKRKKKKKK
jgi:hypothetical protein